MFVLIPELAKESFQAIVKITTLLSIRNWKLRIYNLAYQLLPPLVKGQLFMIFVILQVLIIVGSATKGGECSKKVFRFCKVRDKCAINQCVNNNQYEPNK